MDLWKLTYARLAVPNCWNRLISGGATECAVYARLVTAAGIELVTIDDYECFVDAMRSQHLPR